MHRCTADALCHHASFPARARINANHRYFGANILVDGICLYGSGSTTMTTYGSFKRFVVRTGDAIITIIGRATVTGCDGSTPLQGFSITEGSHTGTSKTHERDDYLDELGSPRVGESSGTVNY